MVGAREELRHEMTPAEKILWNEIRANKLGFHFRRQQIIAGFIVDFYCHKAELVIELDGSVHDEEEQKKIDIEREKALIELGLKVIRFRNEEIVRNLPNTLSKIRELLKD